ncbi:MAG: tyrosine-type recombinase/integrase, partial [Terrimicrobiaceae bacterium]
CACPGLIAHCPGLIAPRQQIRHSLETNDLALARRRLKDWRNDLENTDHGQAARTLQTNAAKFLPTLKGSDSTLANITRHIGKLVDEWPGSSVISKILKSDCQLWLAQYPDLRPATRNKMIRAARDFFKMAVEDKVIARSPMDGITYEKPGGITRLTPNEQQFVTIVADLRSQMSNGHGRDDTADFVELAGRLGLGQAELTAIERQHIHLDEGTIQIFRKKTKKDFTIPIYPAARPIIERRLAALPADPTTRLLPQDDCKKGLEAACKRLKYSHFSPRSLRRFFITSALRLGIDVATVAAWQGHRDGGAMVLKIYGAEVHMNHSLKMAALLGGVPTGAGQESKMLTEESRN